MARNVELAYANAEVEKSKVNIVSIIKAVLFSFLVSVAFLAISAILLTYSSISDEFTKVLVNLAVVVSTITCGFNISKLNNSRGWLGGSIGGLLYILVLYLTGSLILNDFSVSVSSVITFTLGISCGMLGGIMGVNSTKGRRKNKKR